MIEPSPGVRAEMPHAIQAIVMPVIHEQRINRIILFLSQVAEQRRKQQRRVFFLGVFSFILRDSESACCPSSLLSNLQRRANHGQVNPRRRRIDGRDGEASGEVSRESYANAAPLYSLNQVFLFYFL
jgi:hypothetical protein